MYSAMCFAMRIYRWLTCSRSMRSAGSMSSLWSRCRGCRGCRGWCGWCGWCGSAWWLVLLWLMCWLPGTGVSTKLLSPPNIESSRRHSSCMQPLMSIVVLNLRSKRGVDRSYSASSEGERCTGGSVRGVRGAGRGAWGGYGLGPWSLTISACPGPGAVPDGGRRGSEVGERVSHKYELRDGEQERRE